MKSFHPIDFGDRSVREGLFGDEVIFLSEFDNEVDGCELSGEEWVWVSS